MGSDAAAPVGRRPWLAGGLAVSVGSAVVSATRRGAATAGRLSSRGEAESPVRVLMVTATAGFHHSSIETAQMAVPRVGRESGAFTVALLPDLGDLAGMTAEQLAKTDVVFFANTSGELPLIGAQQQALLDFVAAGGGFVGTHSATDTFYEWPEYGSLVGTHFKEHPWTQEVRLAVEDPAHPIMAGLEEPVTVLEEVYVFRSTPRAAAHILFSLDAASVGADPATEDHPLAWCSAFGAGRVFYTALGHFESMWEDARFQRLLSNGFRWASGRT